MLGSRKSRLGEDVITENIWAKGCSTNSHHQWTICWVLGRIMKTMRENNPHHMTSQKQIFDLEAEPQKAFHHLPTPVFSGAFAVSSRDFFATHSWTDQLPTLEDDHKIPKPWKLRGGTLQLVLRVSKKSHKERKPPESWRLLGCVLKSYHIHIYQWSKGNS